MKKFLFVVLFAVMIQICGTVCFAKIEVVAPPEPDTNVYIFNGGEQVYELEERPGVYKITGNKHIYASTYIVKVSLIDKEAYAWDESGDIADKYYYFEILDHVYEIDEADYIIPDDINWNEYNFMKITESGELAGGTCKVNADVYGKVSGGKFEGETTAIYDSEITGGIFEGNIDIIGGKILDGIFNGEVESSARIEGGTFNKLIVSGGIILGGEFNDAVNNVGVINGGTFNEFVQNLNVIYDGDFNEYVYNQGIIAGGIFKSLVSNLEGANIIGGIFKYKLRNSGTVKNQNNYWVEFEGCEISNTAYKDNMGRILLPYKVDKESFVAENSDEIQVMVTLDWIKKDNCYYGENVMDTFGIEKCYEVTNRIKEVSADDTFTLQSQEYLSKLPSSPTPKYTIRFMQDDEKEIDRVTVKSGKLLDKPDTPKLEGYEFVGWYLDKDLQERYEFDKKVTKSFKLYAKWEKISDYCDNDEIDFSNDMENASIFGSLIEKDIVSLILDNRIMLHVRNICKSLGALL